MSIKIENSNIAIIPTDYRLKIDKFIEENEFGTIFHTTIWQTILSKVFTNEN